VFDYDEFKTSLKKAEKILYILDNAGEIVFDMILIEEINKEIVCAVREKPIINDVTLEDAGQVQLERVAKVISSGSDIPGTVVSNCSDEFLKHYQEADIIISKGQGNFETLTDKDKKIFFIFKAKCPVVTAQLGCNLGDNVLLMEK